MVTSQSAKELGPDPVRAYVDAQLIEMDLCRRSRDGVYVIPGTGDLHLQVSRDHIDEYEDDFRKFFGTIFPDILPQVEEGSDLMDFIEKTSDEAARLVELGQQGVGPFDPKITPIQEGYIPGEIIENWEGA